MKIIKLFPGILLSVATAALACWLESLLPIHLIGSAVIAMFIGMFLNQFLRKTDMFASGLKFTSKKILKFAIILLGLSLNISTILHVGKMSQVAYTKAEIRHLPREVLLCGHIVCHRTRTMPCYTDQAVTALLLSLQVRLLSAADQYTL